MVKHDLLARGIAGNVVENTNATLNETNSARVNFAGNAHTTLYSHVVTLETLLSGILDWKYKVKWVIGSIASGIINTTTVKSIVMNEVYYTNVPIRIIMNDYSTYRYAVSFYSFNGSTYNFTSKTGWKYDDYIIPSESYFRIVAMNFSTQPTITNAIDNETFSALSTKTDGDYNGVVDIPNIKNDILNNQIYTISISSSGKTGKPIFSQDIISQKITIKMPAYGLNAHNNKGELIKYNGAYLNQSFNLLHGDILLWNIDDNVILVQHLQSTRNTRNVVLALNLYGAISFGVFKDFWYEYTHKITAKSVIPYNDVLLDVTVNTQIQGMTLVNGLLWQFTGSGENIGEYNGHIIKINPSTLEYTNNCYHDLGHTACLAYNSNNDSLLTGRVISNIPRIQIYKNVSTASIEGSLLLPTDSSCVNIILDSELLNGKTAFEVSMGEQKQILYAQCGALGEHQTTLLMYKILMGMGTNDLSASGYGTFISGCSDEEYNGTCKVFDSWNLPPMDRQTQWFGWYKGHLYVLTGVRDTVLYKYAFINNEFYVDDLIYIKDYNYDGTLIQMEPEGLVFSDNGAYLSLWDKVSPTRFRILKVDI